MGSAHAHLRRSRFAWAEGNSGDECDHGRDSASHRDSRFLFVSRGQCDLLGFPPPLSLFQMVRDRHANHRLVWCGTYCSLGAQAEALFGLFNTYGAERFDDPRFNAQFSRMLPVMRQALRNLEVSSSCNCGLSMSALFPIHFVFICCAEEAAVSRGQSLGRRRERTCRGRP